MASPSFPKPRFPQGSTILVTGATGFVGSNVATELLLAGFKVRAVTRNAERAQSLKQQLESQYGSGTFEIVEVAEPSAPLALDAAVQGVSGIVHTATDASMSTDPDAVIEAVVSFNNGLLEAAAKNESVKSVVLTSSSVAAFSKTGRQPIIAGEQTYQDNIVQLVYSLKDDDPFKAPAVYMASKVKGEQAAWACAKDKDFAFNTVLPDWVTGVPTNPDKTPLYTTYGWLREFAQGTYGPHTALYQFLNPPGFYNDVRDVARAHVAALVADEIKDQRIYAMTELWSIEELAGAIQNAKPHLPLPDYQGSKPKTDIRVPNQAFKDVLKRYYGKPPTSLDETVAATISDL